MRPFSVFRLAAACVAAALAAIVYCGLFASNLVPAGTASAADNPQAYKSLFLEKCSACHNAPDPTVTQNTPQEWRNTVNRMLNQHGASSSISPAEADQIVEYLSLFPPKIQPGDNGPLSIKAADVWTDEPTKSLVFTFSSTDQLKSFNSLRGQWGILTTSTGGPISGARPYLFQAQVTPGDSAILMEKHDPVVGDVDVQTQFRFGPNSAAQTVGLILSASDARNCYIVRFDAARSQISIIQETDGNFTQVDTAPTGDLAQTPDGWHNLRAIYHGDTQSLTVWIDASKKSVTKLARWADNSPMGLMTAGATTAGFRNLTIDMYPAQGASN